MRSLPPWRLGPGGGLFWLLAAMLFAELWLLELKIWLTVWFCYGMFLGARWIWRRNPVGQTIDTTSAARERRVAARGAGPDTSPAPVDLGKL